MDLIQLGLDKGLIKFDAGNKKITYPHINKTWDFTKEEFVRAYTFIELVTSYGYKKENIKFEVTAQQGSIGITAADIVLYYPNKEVFLVIEVKEEDTKTDIEKIKKQAWSYANAPEIKAKYFAYRIGEQPIVTFLIKDREAEYVSHIPYDYEKQVVFAYVNSKPIPDDKKHYQNLKPSTPYNLKQIFKQCHNILWNSGEKDKEVANTEFNKLLFLKMYDELKQEEKHLSSYFFQTYDNETKENLFDRLTEEYKKAVKDAKVEDLLKPFNLTKYQLFEIVKKLETISLIATDNDPKGLAYETFRENLMKGDFGQYFTPRNIVSFMLSISPIEWDNSFTKKSKVLDPCCGSGSFLIHAISHYKHKYPKHWKEFANQSIYGIEHNDQIAITAKTNFALHDDGHDNIRYMNGLNAYLVPDLHVGSFDLILTNPPFGGQPIENNTKPDDNDNFEFKHFYGFNEYSITAKQQDQIELIRNNISETDEHVQRIASQIIFFELYYKMLKVGGIAEVVIPDGLLTNSSEQFVRDWIMEHFQILAVFSLPQFTFSHYGAGVKSSIIIVKKLDLAITKKIQIAKEKYLVSAVNEKKHEIEKLEKEKEEIPNKYLEIRKLLADQQEELTISEKQNLNPKTKAENIKQIKKNYKEKIDAIKKTTEYAEWKKAQTEDINEQIKSIKEAIYDAAQDNFHKFETEFNYPIFMAIADHIGYDATGKATKQNDLDKIAKEYLKFIEKLNDNG